MKINFHAHTHNSDGQSDMLTSVNIAKSLGYGALVVTNHDHMFGFGSYFKDVGERKVLKDLKLTDFPIIIGSEISWNGMEMLLFGEDIKDHSKTDSAPDSGSSNVIENWYRDFAYGNFLTQPHLFASFISMISHQTDYAMILCHPRYYTAETIMDWPNEFCELFHGFEIQNFKEDYEKELPDVVDALRKRIGGRELRNSDAHSDYCWKVAEDIGAFNETDTDIKNEKDLLEWMKRKSIKEVMENL